MSIRYWGALLAAPILMASSPSIAAEFKEVYCPATHFLRQGGGERHTTNIAVANTSPDKSATWTRLTFYDAFGNQVWDSGPDTGTPHPPNLDLGPGDQDVTNIVPRRTVYLNTWHVFGFEENILGDWKRGFAVQVYIRVETEGKAKDIVVGGNRRARGTEMGEERMRMSITCRVLKSGKIK